MKHTTFCDVVTVVDSNDGEVREERLVYDDDIDEDEVSPTQTTGVFFLNPNDTELAPVDELDGGSVVPSDSFPAVQKDEVFEEEKEKEGLSKDVTSVAYVFSTAATPQSDTEEPNVQEEPTRKLSGTLRTTKHVNLIDLMAQIRGDDGGERS